MSKKISIAILLLVAIINVIIISLYYLSNSQSKKSIYPLSTKKHVVKKPHKISLHKNVNKVKRDIERFKPPKHIIKPKSVSNHRDIRDNTVVFPIDKRANISVDSIKLKSSETVKIHTKNNKNTSNSVCKDWVKGDSVVIKDECNVRDKPTIKGKVVDRLFEGDILATKRVDSRWYKIESVNGVDIKDDRYIHKDMVRKLYRPKNLNNIYSVMNKTSLYRNSDLTNKYGFIYKGDIFNGKKIGKKMIVDIDNNKYYILSSRVIDLSKCDNIKNDLKRYIEKRITKNIDRDSIEKKSMKKLEKKSRIKMIDRDNIEKVVDSILKKRVDNFKNSILKEIKPDNSIVKEIERKFNRKLTEINKRVDSINTKINRYDKIIKNLNKKVISLDKRLNNIERDLQQYSSKIDRVFELLKKNSNQEIYSEISKLKEMYKSLLNTNRTMLDDIKDYIDKRAIKEKVPKKEVRSNIEEPFYYIGMKKDSRGNSIAYITINNEDVYEVKQNDVVNDRWKILEILPQKLIVKDIVNGNSIVIKLK